MKNTQPPKHITDREVWIDYLRGLGIILMIIGHTRIWGPVIKWVYGFHIPLFFVLSGYLFNKQKWTERSYRSFIHARFRNYIIPYFIWCGLCFFINLPLLYYLYRQNDFSAALIQNLGWIITSVSVDGLFLPQNCTPLWFLTCLFISQQVFYWLVQCKIGWQFILSSVFFAVNYFLNWFKTPILPWHFEVALIGSVFMLAGYYVKELHLTDKRSLGAIVVFAVISSIIILLNGPVNLYYRQYGNDLLAFTISASMMCYSFISFCRSMKKYYYRKIVCNLGIYSILVMGLNYSINRYSRAIYQILSGRTDQNSVWIEYGLIIINILICLLVISKYKIKASKNKRLSIIVGK